MGKYAPDLTLDQELLFISGANFLTICSGSPTTFADCFVNLMLAKVALTGADFGIANDSLGRKLTVAQKDGFPILNSGTALACCLVETAGSTVRFVTTTTSQPLTAAGTVTSPSWKINIQPPV